MRGRTMTQARKCGVFPRARYIGRRDVARRRSISRDVTRKAGLNHTKSHVKHKDPILTSKRMASDERSYIEEYTLDECIADSEGTLSPVEIVKMITSVAKGHFQRLSGDDSDVPRSEEMVQLGLTFMLSRLTIAFQPFQLSNSNQLSIETCFKPQKVSFKRDFAVKDVPGRNVVATATSSYVLVNLKSRKLERAPAEMVAKYESFSSTNVDRLSAELPKKTKISQFQLEEAQNKSVFVVQEEDIDDNGHVEGTVYVDWILDSVAKSSSTLALLDIEYKQECFLGQEIHSLSQTIESEEGKDISHIVQTKDGVVLLRAHSKWTF